MAGTYVTPAQLQQALDDLEQRQGVLIRQLQGGGVLEGGSWMGAGPWAAGAPGPTAGIPIVVQRAGTWRISCMATAFQTGGAVGFSIEVDVYLDGGLLGQMLLSADTTPGAHLVLSRFSADVALAAGTHYVAFRQVAGTSNAADRGSIEATRIR